MARCTPARPVTPVPSARCPCCRAEKIRQLIQSASLISLEKTLLADGQSAAILQSPQRNWSGLGKPLQQWIGATAKAIASAIVAGVSIIDFQRIVIDGAVPRDVLAQLVAKVRDLTMAMKLHGLSPFEIVEGTMGADARVIGGAMLPINFEFGCAPEVMLKTLKRAAAVP